MAWDDCLPADRGWVRKQLKEQRQSMNATIAAFQSRFNAAIVTANQNLDKLETRVAADETKMAADDAKISLDETTIAALKAEEADLRKQIADLQAKQAAGTFGDDDAAALADIETKYQAILARIGADVTPPAPVVAGGPPASA